MHPIWVILLPCPGTLDVRKLNLAVTVEVKLPKPRFPFDQITLHDHAHKGYWLSIPHDSLITSFSCELQLQELHQPRRRFL